jgi:peptidoglycan/xylan/chitin deacetylase (PgdA/CDA1 family)
MRAPYVPAPERPRLTLPHGKRLAVHVAVNVEDWHYDEQLPRIMLPAPRGHTAIPDVPNFAWYSYGMRVGIWRTIDALAAVGARATLSLNASVCDTYPQIIEATERAGWEIMGHGVHQRVMPLEKSERATVREALARVERATGKRPRGWLGPGLAESFETADILASEGLIYCCDWGAADDLPYDLTVSSGRLISVPYAVEMNDVVMYGVEQRPDDMIWERGKRTFDRLYAESETQAKIMPIALHPWIVGVPHRIGYLEELLRHLAVQPGVVFMTAGEIADWYAASRTISE